MELIDILDEIRILPMADFSRGEGLLPTVGALCSGGISALCVKNWNDEIAASVRAAGDMYIGARACSEEEALFACPNNARFIFTYGIYEKVLNICRKFGADYLPGCITPSEIIRAEELGLSAVMLCPVELFGGKSLCARYEMMFPKMKFIAYDMSNNVNFDEYLDDQKLLAVCSDALVSGSLEEIAEKSRLHMQKYFKN